MPIRCCRGEEEKGLRKVNRGLKWARRDRPGEDELVGWLVGGGIVGCETEGKLVPREMLPYALTWNN